LGSRRIALFHLRHRATIGYGDVTPKSIFGRLLALIIGLAGIVLTGLIAAISVQALRAAEEADASPEG
jgi:hypothetical protein